METYYLVGLKEKSGAMIPIYDSRGNDKPPDPLSTTKDEATKYRDYMQKLYPDEKYCCLKAEIIEEEEEKEK